MRDKNVDQINKYLETAYGRYLDGRPIFRVVWAGDQYEFRHGTFEEYSGPIFLRSFTGIKQVKKYNYIQENRWILEKFVPPPNSICEDLPDSIHGTYEPLYIFEAKGQALKPILSACQLAIYVVLNPWNKEKKDAFIKELVDQVEIEDRKVFDAMLDNESNHFLHKLHFGEAILNPRRQNE